MFNQPLSEIEYHDVEVFCKNTAEGVRVEYKRELGNIPKIISAFANTLGGVFVVGVEADKTTNKVIAFDGVHKEEGLEEKIESSARDGIYPSVFPDIKILDIPEKADKVIILIRVQESILAPHAMQNSTRAYIRTGSTTHPCELAEMDRISYWFKRREKPNELKDQIKKRSEERIRRVLGSPEIFDKPCLSMSISPALPYQPLSSLDRLFRFFQTEWPNSNNQRIADGVCSYGREAGVWYKELNIYGYMCVWDILEKSEESVVSSNKDLEGIEYLRISHILHEMAKFFKLATKYYKACEFMGNLEVEANLRNIYNEHLLVQGSYYGQDDLCISKDESSFSKHTCSVEEIAQKPAEIINILCKNFLWSFNSADSIEKLIGRHI